ncbi:hypothetical protein M595_2369 [Lyngbya aestuarii BL J]|uniref:Uncharacterized protein n=1 Tax=Lyngbya aestuarii BL J TaxID=1348334 RepID=U7QI32_9CYAN|nr:hypothetical protein [Lyngbya aestuarii]ERT07629.1 hypothetical protein M595_2369 [Lyngbya aestuarii BL J]
MEDNTNKNLTSKSEDNLKEETQEINALAKAFMVSLTWSMAGLTTAKKSPQSKEDTPQ